MLEKRINRIVTVDEMQFGFMPERGTIDAVFILRRMQCQHHAKGKNVYMDFIGTEKAFDRVSRNVWNVNEEDKNTISLG